MTLCFWRAKAQAEPACAAEAKPSTSTWCFHALSRRCSARAGGAARCGEGLGGAGGGGGGGGARQREQRAVRQQPGGQRVDLRLQLHAQQPVCQASPGRRIEGPSLAPCNLCHAVHSFFTGLQGASLTLAPRLLAPQQSRRQDQCLGSRPWRLLAHVEAGSCGEHAVPSTRCCWH